MRFCVLFLSLLGFHSPYYDPIVTAFQPYALTHPPLLLWKTIAHKLLSVPRRALAVGVGGVAHGERRLPTALRQSVSQPALRQSVSQPRPSPICESGRRSLSHPRRRLSHLSLVFLCCSLQGTPRRRHLPPSESSPFHHACRASQRFKSSQSGGRES